MSSRPGTAPAAAADKQDFTHKNLISSSSSSGPTFKSAAVSALAWSHNGRKLAAASEDGLVKVWSVTPDAVQSSKTDKPEQDFALSKGSCITCLLFHPKRDDQLLVVCNTTRVYTLAAKGSPSIYCQADTPEALEAVWDPSDTVLVACRQNAFVCFEARKAPNRQPPSHHLFLEDGRQPGQAPPFGADKWPTDVTGLHFIDRGRKVLVATSHGVEVRSLIKQGSKVSWQRLTVLDGHAKFGPGREGGVTAMAVTREEDSKPHRPLSRLLATGGRDTLICIWDLQQAVPQSIIYRPDATVRALSFNADQALLGYSQDAVPGQASGVQVMDVSTGRHVVSLPLAVSTEFMAFSPRHSKLLAVVEPQFLPTRDGKPVKGPNAGWVSLVLLK